MSRKLPIFPSVRGAPKVAKSFCVLYFYVHEISPFDPGVQYSSHRPDLLQLFFDDNDRWQCCRFSIATQARGGNQEMCKELTNKRFFPHHLQLQTSDIRKVKKADIAHRWGGVRMMRKSKGGLNNLEFQDPQRVSAHVQPTCQTSNICSLSYDQCPTNSAGHARLKLLLSRQRTVNGGHLSRRRFTF